MNNSGKKALSREEFESVLSKWQQSWATHDLDGVMALFHDDVTFENWTGGRALGKQALRRAWTSWFANHNGFRFIEEDIFIDVRRQKVLFRWQLQWPSRERDFEGQFEKRRGVDVLHFQNGKIIHKLTYSQTVVEIDGIRVWLSARSS
jgi:ketosteroid isomerase-like protein